MTKHLFESYTRLDDKKLQHADKREIQRSSALTFNLSTTATTTTRATPAATTTTASMAT